MNEPRWAALCAATESDLPHEMRAVMWVIRYRVEAQGRYRDSYEGVVLQRRQFSAFNRWTEDAGRLTHDEIFLAASRKHGPPDGQWELWMPYRVALDTMRAPAWEAPFGPKVTEYWSPVSMLTKGELPPWNWSLLRCFALPGIDRQRFVFAETTGSKDAGNAADYDFRHLYEGGETA